MTDKEKFWAGIGCGSLPIVLVISTLWGGLVLSVVWNWFMPEIFGLPQLSIMQAIAVGLVVEYLTQTYTPQEKSGDVVASWISALLIVFFRPLFVLAIGFVVKLVM